MRRRWARGRRAQRGLRCWRVRVGAVEGALLAMLASVVLGGARGVGCAEMRVQLGGQRTASSKTSDCHDITARRAQAQSERERRWVAVGKASVRAARRGGGKGQEKQRCGGAPAAT